ncbi:hypothetical protein ACQPUZ_04785 [Clostridium tertium]
MNIEEIMVDIIKIVKENTSKTIMGETIKEPSEKDYSISKEAFGRIVLEMKRNNLIDVKYSRGSGIPEVIFWNTARVKDGYIIKLIEEKLNELPDNIGDEVKEQYIELMKDDDEQSFKEKYDKFLEKTAQYMTILGPFIGLIPMILGK